MSLVEVRRSGTSSEEVARGAKRRRVEKVCAGAEVRVVQKRWEEVKKVPTEAGSDGKSLSC